MTIVEKPTKNHNGRPLGERICCIVLHADAATNEAGTISWIQNPTSGVSYHYLIGRDGTVYRFVPDQRRAWHAGKSAWEGVTDVNDFSIGVSFSNDQKDEAFTRAALDAGADLCAQLCRRHDLSPTDAVLTTHAIVARPPGRKTDPGPRFPLTQFRKDVRALCPPVSTITEDSTDG